jgi:hypothetical protein
MSEREEIDEAREALQAIRAYCEAHANEGRGLYAILDLLPPPRPQIRSVAGDPG